MKLSNAATIRALWRSQGPHARSSSHNTVYAITKGCDALSKPTFERHH
jgi:hypothetical protein